MPAALQQLVDMLARRHALALVWALRGSAQPFRTLARQVAAPEAQAAQRLRELRETGLVEVDEAGDYRLSTHGRRLLGLVEPLAGYAAEWAALGPRQRVPRGQADRGRGEPG